MTEQQAKQHLIEMLDSFTLGSILHLLADVQRDAADQVRQADDSVAVENARVVEHTLFVVGLGVDAVRPN